MQLDRICGIIICFFSVLYFIACFFIPNGLVIETLGPRVFPMIVGIAFFVVGLILIIQNQPLQVLWEKPIVWVSLAKVLLSILVYAFFITKLGFLVSTSALGFALAKYFGGAHKTAIFTGLGISIILYILFDIVLDIPLPWGEWVAFLIEER